MGTTKDDLKRWFECRVAQGATHMIVVCDTFNYEDYPVYVASEQDVKEEVNNRNGKNMARVMEVYNLKMTWEEQSDSESWNY